MRLSVTELNKQIKGKVQCDEWLSKLTGIVKKNKDLNKKLMSDPVVPMTYYSSY